MQLITKLKEVDKRGNRLALKKCNKCGFVFKTPILNMEENCGCDKRHLPLRERYKKEYSMWVDMRRNCANVKARSYPLYGGKGVKVCQKWDESFKDFFSDMGYREDDQFLRRIDTLKDFGPDNCYWGLKRNKKFWIIKGHTFTAAHDAANHFKVQLLTIHRWVKGYKELNGRAHPPKDDCSVVPNFLD